MVVVGPTEIHGQTPPGLSPGTLNDVAVDDGMLPGRAPASVATLSGGWLSDFLDVPGGDLFHADVEKIFRLGLTAGCGGGSYCRDAPVTRAQMAVFLLKAEHGSAYAPPACTGVFDDVACPGHPFADWIEQLWAEGVTTGCGGNDYCPAAAVTRRQMAVFLLKTSLGPGYVPPPPDGIFGDVPVESPFAPWIENLYGLGITGGCQSSPLRFCPASPSTRGQMAVFLVRTFGF